MAASLVGINTLKIQPFKLPELGPQDVRIQMKAVGICGSDVHYLKAMRVADFIVKEPMSPVSDAGGVNLAKKYNLCPDMKFFATPLVLGSLANQVVHPAGLCFNF
ncbi:hypothetical protein ACLB2K_075125 [Fragaria x ananassa]